MALWRRLKGLGVAQLADGVVGLPADARTREQFSWLAEAIAEAIAEDNGGVTTVWVATPSGRYAGRELAASMTCARVPEYRALIDEVGGTDPAAADATRAVARLRGLLRRIRRRDYFPPPQRVEARRAVDELASPNRKALRVDTTTAAS